MTREQACEAIIATLIERHSDDGTFDDEAFVASFKNDTADLLDGLPLDRLAAIAAMPGDDLEAAVDRLFMATKTLEALP